MATENLFEDLKEVLGEFKTFLDENVGVIQPAIAALKSIIPDQIDDLFSKLIDLMGKLKTEIQNLDVSAIPGLSEASEFTGQITTFLNSAKDLLPDEADTIDDVLGAANVVAGLPSLDDVKVEILALVDAITAHLNTLNA